MKISNHSNSLILLALAGSLAFSGCATEIGPDGRPRNVITPLGAAAIQTVTAAGIGAGAGALMPHMNSVAAGAIAAGAGSIGSQAINAVLAQYQATPKQKQIAVTRAQSLYEKMDDSEKAKVKTIAVVTEKTDTTQGVPIMYVDPKTMQVENNTVYNCNQMPQGQVVRSSDVATAFN